MVKRCRGGILRAQIEQFRLFLAADGHLAQLGCKGSLPEDAADRSLYRSRLRSFAEVAQRDAVPIFSGRSNGFADGDLFSVLRESQSDDLIFAIDPQFLAVSQTPKLIPLEPAQVLLTRLRS